MKKIAIYICFTLLLFSCGNKNEDETNTQTNINVQEEQNLAEPESTNLWWGVDADVQESSRN